MGFFPTKIFPTYLETLPNAKFQAANYIPQATPQNGLELHPGRLFALAYPPYLVERLELESRTPLSTQQQEWTTTRSLIMNALSGQC